MRPQKNGMRLELNLPKDEETDDIITAADLDILDYDKRWGKYRIKLTASSIQEKSDVLASLLEKAYQVRR